eukprot:scpid53118/ scgid32053/ Alpha-(1,3)-fucosyltransferase 11; Fucosyltransferase XI; Galactoside 3-L-fucosyltransferase 11
MILVAAKRRSLVRLLASAVLLASVLLLSALLLPSGDWVSGHGRISTSSHTEKGSGAWVPQALMHAAGLVGSNVSNGVTVHMENVVASSEQHSEMKVVEPARRDSRGVIADIGRNRRRRPMGRQYSTETELAKVSAVWGSEGATYAWPRSVMLYAQCRHPGKVAVCRKPRKQFLVLLWDERYWSFANDHPFSVRPPSDGLLHFGCCDGVDMVYTTDRTKLAVADIVDFHPRYNKHMPKRGHPHQVFMMSSAEPPYLVGFRPLLMKDVNLLRSFSRSSDIQQSLTEPGECFCKKYVQPLKVPFEKRHRVRVSALISNCIYHGAVARKKLLQYLMSTIEVHSMGGCFHNHAMPTGQSVNIVLGQYLFNFAVENSICLDYITEKFHRALIAGTVPIVLTLDNMPGYEFVAPTEHSYVDLSRYTSIQDAVRFINDSSSSAQAYYRHHSYRGEPINSTLLSHTFRTRLCAANEDDLSEWCNIVKRMETRKGREQILQKTYANYYRETIPRQCASRGSMARHVPNTGADGRLLCWVAVAIVLLGSLTCLACRANTVDQNNED